MTSLQKIILKMQDEKLAVFPVHFYLQFYY